MDKLVMELQEPTGWLQRKSPVSHLGFNQLLLDTTTLALFSQQVPSNVGEIITTDKLVMELQEPTG
jgi:hypothetical protein